MRNGRPISAERDVQSVRTRRRRLGPLAPPRVFSRAVCIRRLAVIYGMRKGDQVAGARSVSGDRGRSGRQVPSVLKAPEYQMQRSGALPVVEDNEPGSERGILSDDLIFADSGAITATE